MLCFFPEAISDLHRDGTLSLIGHFSAQLGGAGIYATDDRRVALFHPGVGGPLSAHSFERAIASGVTRAIAVGGAGAIDSRFGKDDVLVVTSAVRDEGTSFHYLADSRTVELDDEEACRSPGVPNSAVFVPSGCDRRH